MDDLVEAQQELKRFLYGALDQQHAQRFLSKSKVGYVLLNHGYD